MMTSFRNEYYNLNAKQTMCMLLSMILDNAWFFNLITCNRAKKGKSMYVQVLEVYQISPSLAIDPRTAEASRKRVCRYFCSNKYFKSLVNPEQKIGEFKAY